VLVEDNPVLLVGDNPELTKLQLNVYVVNSNV